MRGGAAADLLVAAVIAPAPGRWSWLRSSVRLWHAGEADLFELRPRQGSSKARPLVVRRSDGYLIVAVAADHAKDMRRAVADAHERLEARGELAE